MRLAPLSATHRAILSRLPSGLICQPTSRAYIAHGRVQDVWQLSTFLTISAFRLTVAVVRVGHNAATTVQQRDRRESTFRCRRSSTILLLSPIHISHLGCKPIMISRSRDGPVQFLRNWSGYLQADAFSGYDGIYLGRSGVHHNHFINPGPDAFQTCRQSTCRVAGDHA